MVDWKLQAVELELDRARAHLVELERAMDAADRAGMYPAVPVREAWEPRENGREYMYHYFARGQAGYRGPDGKRKVYVGSDPDRIAAARRLAGNREAWERLADAHRRLKRWLAGVERDLENLTAAAARWPRTDLAELGLTPPPAVAPESPK